MLLVDDSIVRGTTSREIVRMVKEAGASQVYFCSASPPVSYSSGIAVVMTFVLRPMVVCHRG